MRQISHKLRPGDRVTAANGYFPNGASRPHRTGTIEELYGPNDWPRVRFDDTPDYLETCVPNAITKVN